MRDVPKKLGKYDILAEIGRGSMGIVYRAFDPYINREVAVKVAMAEALKDKDTGERFRKMFFNEAHTAVVAIAANPCQRRNGGEQLGNVVRAGGGRVQATQQDFNGFRQRT